MTKRQELLRDYVELLNQYGPNSDECREFRAIYADDEEFASLARIATQLKIVLTQPAELHCPEPANVEQRVALPRLLTELVDLVDLVRIFEPVKE